MAQKTILTMKGITKTFPGVKALSNVDFKLCEGDIHALMGENGAGKSTLIKVLTGIYPFDAGEIIMDGKAMVNKSPQDAQNNGISTVYQEVNLCPNLTVAENLFIGREPKKLGMINWKEMNSRSKVLLESLDIDVAPTTLLDECSIAIQQMIAIARAVDMECKVLILDEPTSSLDEEEVEKLFALMKKLKAKGVGIIFVTHFLEQVYEVCDKITVLRNGELVGEYDVENLPRVQLVAASSISLRFIGLNIPRFACNAIIMFSRTDRSARIPSFFLSSGKYAIPAFIASNGAFIFTFLPKTFTSPVSALSAP